MSLTILNVAYPLAPVSMDSVGGAEQVVAALDHALTAAGHRSIVVACEGSTVEGELIATPLPSGAWDDAARREAHRKHREAINQALQRWPVDLIHLHGIDCYEYLPQPGAPVLITLHLPPDWYPPEIFQLTRPQTYLHCVSQSQHRACPPTPLLLPPITNGVRLDLFRPRPQRQRYVMSLGRICREKGFHLAIQAARNAGVPLLLAGEVFPYDDHRRYFEQEIEPELDQCRQYIGPIGLMRKRRLLSRARCLLATSQVAETSSLVAMEALASGCPVIAFPHGALADIVEDGRTGFLVRSVEEMSRAIRQVSRLSSDDCRHAAEQRFSMDRSAAEYLDRYRQLTGPIDSSHEQSSYRVEWIEDTESLQKLDAEWNALWDRCEYATPFQTFTWNLAWWQHLGHGQLRTVAIWKGDRLVGLAPLFLYHDREADKRRLLILGTSITDQMDVLIDPVDSTGILDCLWRALTERQAEWDVCDLQDLPAHSPLLGDESKLGPGATEPYDLCRVVTLADTPEQWMAQLPHGLRRNLRRYRDKLNQTGTVEAVVAGPDNFKEFFQGFLDLHQAQWEAQGKSGMLGEERVRRFHEAAAGELFRQGYAHFTGIRHNGSLIAVLYFLSCRGRAYAYLSGYSPQWSAYGPGSLQIADAMEHAIQLGLREWDFLRGREPYKLTWGAEDRTTYRRVISFD